MPPSRDPPDGPLLSRGGDRLAVLLLLVGCLTGVGILIREQRTPRLPAAGPPAAETQISREALVQRVRELEQRLLDTVPRSVESKYNDL